MGMNYQEFGFQKRLANGPPDRRERVSARAEVTTREGLDSQTPAPHRTANSLFAPVPLSIHSRDQPSPPKSPCPLQGRATRARACRRVAVEVAPGRRLQPRAKNATQDPCFGPH